MKHCRIAVPDLTDNRADIFAEGRIHKAPCKRCPSAHYAPDPEAQDIAAMWARREIPLEYAVFSCAWRPDALCRGVCDRLGVTAEDLRREALP